MELVDTIEIMISNDYKERFKAEYAQLSIRLNKLAAMLEKYSKDELDFKPDTPFDVLKTQFNAMSVYRNTLTIRAALEDIDLHDIDLRILNDMMKNKEVTGK